VSEESKKVPTIPAGPWMNEHQAAEYVQYSVMTLRSWRSRGLGPRYFRRGRPVRYYKDDLDAWIRELGPQ
jgi:hypothetical protein